MSSFGSSISSQSAEDLRLNQPVTRHGGPPLGKIKSEHGTSSFGEPTYDNSNRGRLMQSSGSDGPMYATGFNGSPYTELGSSSHGPHAVRNFSNNSDHEPPTWSEFLRESSSLTGGASLANDADTMSTVAADRKRRLTASAQDSGRRRTVSGGFHNRHLSGPSYQFDGPSSPRISAWPRRTDSIDRSQPNYIDLTSSPPAAARQLAEAGSATPPLLRTRQYVLPKWQPDSEVSECPICKRQFSLLFRRHHCRKCGRVVCNDCSPHRITIPRQFIVHPPDSSAQIQLGSPVTLTPAETIDLTEDTGRDARPDWTRTTTAGSNPALGGGEKVRLCNPCVPDPQPSPHLDPSLSRPLTTNQTPWEVTSGNARPPRGPSDLAIPQLANMYQAGFSDQASELRRHRGRSMMFQPVGSDADLTRTGVADTSHLRTLPYGVLENAATPNFSRRDRPPSYRSYPHAAAPPPRYHATGASHFPTGTSGSSQSRGAGPGAVSPPVDFFMDAAKFLQQALFPPNLHQPAGMQLPLHGHARYQSLDLASRPTPIATSRPRVRSLLDADPGLQRFLDQATASGSSRLSLEARPRLHERDICPVCRHALPPPGLDGDETAREAHIMECIASRDRSTTHSTPAPGPVDPSTPPVPVRMLPFVASEKDCVGEDGNIQECSICMVEYDVGDQLARLECLCKFHKACIVEWFGRKPECPLHKIA